MQLCTNETQLEYSIQVDNFMKSFTIINIIVQPPPTSRPITESPIAEIEEPQTTTHRKEEETEVELTETTTSTTTEGPVPEIKMRKIIKVIDIHQSNCSYALKIIEEILISIRENAIAC